MKRSIKIYLCAAIAAVLGSGIASADTLATWSFNDGGTSAERLAADNAVAGVTVSGLDFNGLSTDTGTVRGFFDAQPGGGISVLPWHESNGVATNYDGIGFGGNGGEQVMFLHRALFFDGSPVRPKPKAEDYTSFGDGSQGTTAGDADGHAPISFTVENAGTEDVNIVGLAVHNKDGGGFIFNIQEAGASPGTSVTIGNGATDTALVSGGGVVVGVGQTKTFTININTGALDSRHSLNYFELISGAPPVVASLLTGQPVPVVNDADIAMTDQTGAFSAGGGDAIWGNQPAQGTTFTTGNHPAGYTLRSFSIQMGGPNFRDDPHSWPWKARVGKVEGAVMTEVIRDYEEAADFNSWGTNDTWATLTFSTPVHLEPETVYGADFGCQAGGWGGATTFNPDNNLYPGGAAYRSGTAGTGDANLTFNGSERLFHLDMTLVPLPDPTLLIDSGTYGFGRLYHPTGTDSSAQTITYRNGGETENITIDSITLTDDASGIFTITAAPANGTVVAPGGTFDV